MAFVTLPGAGGITSGVVTVQAGSGDHLFYAQLIANTILTAATLTGSLQYPANTVVAGSGTTIAPPPSGAGTQQILYISGAGGGNIAIPSGYNYVVDLVTGPETVTGNNVQVIAYDSAGSASGPGGIFDLTGSSSLAADPADNNVATLSGTFVGGFGDGNNTVLGLGAGTIGGGTGTNVYNIAPVAPGAGILLRSSGTGDVVNVTDAGTATVYSFGSDMNLQDGGTGALTVVDDGANDTVSAIAAATATATVAGAGDKFFGGSNPAVVSVTGTNDTVVGGAGSLNVSLSGTDALVLGGSGSLTVDDAGTADTIATFGASPANVTLSGSSAIFFGGSNTTNVSVHGTNNTIVGSSGTDSVVIGSTGVATDNVVFGGSGGLILDDEGQGDSIGPFSANPANVTLGSSSNADILFGGSSSLTAVVTGTNDTIAAGSGPSTITASTGAAIFGGSGLVNFVGGAGTSTLMGGTGGSEMATVGSGGLIFFTGTNNSSSILGSATATTVIGGSGSSVLFSSLSGGGADFLAGSGNETLGAATTGSSNLGFFDALTSVVSGTADSVSGWTTADNLFLTGYDSSSTATVASGSSTVFTLSDGTTITFSDTTGNDFTGKVHYINPS